MHWWSAQRPLPIPALIVIAASVVGARDVVHAQPRPQPPPLVSTLAPPSGDDARLAVPLGPAGEIYEPDGQGAWVRRMRVSTATTLEAAGRAGRAVVAFGEGVVYRLAPNGWTAIRLHQKSKAVMSEGSGAVAAVGRQIFALDRTAGGEPLKLAVAPGNVTALGTTGAGRSILAVTDRGAVFRIDGARATAVKNAPKRITRVVSDRWVLVADGAIDLRTGKKTGWPTAITIAAVAAGPRDRLVLVATTRGKLELVTVDSTKLVREPVDGGAGGTPVGVATDSAGRVVIALRDGQVVVRDHGVWSVTRVRTELAPARPGAPPATSP